jgi:hypothetical protein
VSDDYELNPIDMDLDAFRDSVLAHLARQDLDGLRQDSQAVMAPIFVEKFINDIAPGNPWNDVLYLMARKLMEVSADVRYLSTELEAKRPLAGRPDADLEDLMSVEINEQGLSLRLRD